MQDEFAHALRIGGGQLRGDHPAERMATDGGRLEPEFIEQFVVVEDQVPEVVEAFDRIGVTVAGARMFRAYTVKSLARRSRKSLQINP